MKKFAFLIIFSVMFLAWNISAFAKTPDNVYKNRLFSITLPEELKGTYEVKTEKDRISVFHKEFLPTVIFL